MSRFLPLPAIVLTVLASVASLAAQQQTIFRAGARTVPLYATVQDKSGRLIPDLHQDDFEIYDNGKLQPTTLFENAGQPVTVVVMLDTSGSMTMNIDLLKAAAEQFVIRLLPADRARIGSFSDKIRLSPSFTGDRNTLIRILHEDIDFGNPTRLWDACDTAMTALASEQGRRVVLVFTDGYDDPGPSGSNTSFDDVLKRATTQEYMVYSIGLQSIVRGSRTKPDPGIRKLAEETGGGYFELQRITSLGDTFTRVVQELHSQYVLGFTPAVLDGKVHKLELRVKQPGLTARARKTYVAAPDK